MGLMPHCSPSPYCEVRGTLGIFVYLAVLGAAGLPFHRSEEVVQKEQQQCQRDHVEFKIPDSDQKHLPEKQIRGRDS